MLQLDQILQREKVKVGFKVLLELFQKLLQTGKASKLLQTTNLFQDKLVSYERKRLGPKRCYYFIAVTCRKNVCLS